MSVMQFKGERREDGMEGDVNKMDKRAGEIMKGNGAEKG